MSQLFNSDDNQGFMENGMDDNQDLFQNNWKSLEKKDSGQTSSQNGGLSQKSYSSQLPNPSSKAEPKPGSKPKTKPGSKPKAKPGSKSGSKFVQKTGTAKKTHCVKKSDGKTFCETVTIPPSKQSEVQFGSSNMQSFGDNWQVKHQSNSDSSSQQQSILQETHNTGGSRQDQGGQMMNT